MMITERLTQEEIRTANRLASKPLGHELAKFPLRFAASVLIGEKASGCVYTPKGNNGSVQFSSLEDCILS